MPCRCKERREWIKTRIVDPATGKLVQVLKTLKDTNMSLTDRLRKIEADIADLKRRADERDEALTNLLDVWDTEAEGESEEPARTLDGETFGGERDQTQPL